MKKTLLVFIIMAICGGLYTSTAQDYEPERLNNYKYVVIPMQFSFQSKENQYLINSQVMHLLDQHHFNTYTTVEEYPGDLIFNPCLAVHVNLISGSEGAFSTHTELTLVFKDCNNKVVYKTKTGYSRAKDFDEGYREALLDAFTSFSGYEHHYNEEGIAVKKEPEKAKKDESLTPNKKEESPLSVVLGKTYNHAGKTVEVIKIEAGYLLENKQTKEKIAFLRLTESNTILYNSKTINGTATVKENGAVIQVEYFDTQSGEMEKIVYRQKVNN